MGEGRYVDARGVRGTVGTDVDAGRGCVRTGLAWWEGPAGGVGAGGAGTGQAVGEGVTPGQTGSGYQFVLGGHTGMGCGGSVLCTVVGGWDMACWCW